MSRYGAGVPEVTRDLADALIEVVRERMTQEGTTVLALAEKMGVQRPTLSRQLRGNGTLTIDEWDALARAVGEQDLEGLLLAARRRM